MHEAAPPMVSVCMITYNHCLYISQAINSVLSQQCHFPIELVIGEDHSNDGTDRIVNEFAVSEPHRIRARSNECNVGMISNLQRTLQACRGKYIALLEGDDYWTNPEKLVKQVAFMEANPDFSLCFHPVDVLENGRIVADRFTRAVDEITDIYELARGNFMHTCSVLFRAGLFAQFPESFGRSPIGDYFLHMLNAQHGCIRKLPEKMAVYRVHEGGVWSHHDNIDLKVIEYLECMIGCFSPRVNDILIARHKDVSIRSFARRINEAGATQRLERCEKYGSERLIAAFADLLKRDKGSPLSRPFLKIAHFIDSFM